MAHIVYIILWLPTLWDIGNHPVISPIILVGQFLLVHYGEFNVTDSITEIATGPILWVIQFFVAIHADNKSFV